MKSLPSLMFAVMIVAVALVVVAPQAASAQAVVPVVTYYVPSPAVTVASPVTVARPVTTYYTPAPQVVYRPVTTYSPVVTTYSPVVTAYSPVVTTYSPVVTAASPVVYQPPSATVVYHRGPLGILPRRTVLYSPGYVAPAVAFPTTGVIVP